MNKFTDLEEIVVNDNGFAFLTLIVEGDVLNISDCAEKCELNWDLTSFKSFKDLCKTILKDTYPYIQWCYDNAETQKRKIEFLYKSKEGCYNSAKNVRLKPSECV